MSAYGIETMIHCTVKKISQTRDANVAVHGADSWRSIHRFKDVVRQQS